MVSIVKDTLNLFQTNFSGQSSVNQYQIRIESSHELQGPSQSASTTWGRVEIQLLNEMNGKNETFVLTQEADELKEGGIIQVGSLFFCLNFSLEIFGF